jgi:hypothetical protein
MVRNYRVVVSSSLLSFVRLHCRGKVEQAARVGANVTHRFVLCTLDRRLSS